MPMSVHYTGVYFVHNLSIAIPITLQDANNASRLSIILI